MATRWQDYAPEWEKRTQTKAEWQKIAQSDHLARWLGATSPTPDGLVLGVHRSHGTEDIVAISDDARTRHVYIVGSSGSGKTTLLANMMKQDMEQGKGCAVIDPLGPLIDAVLPHVPESRVFDIAYFDPSDQERPISLNPLIAETEDDRERVAENFMLLFKRLFRVGEDAPRLLDILRHVVWTLLESGNKTFFDIGTILVDPDFRAEVLRDIANPVLLEFWDRRFPTYPRNAIDPVVNKLGQFRLAPTIRSIFNQPGTSLDFAELMKYNQCFFANLAEGKVISENSMLLGSVVVSMIQLATNRRRTLPQSLRPLYSLYVDEFQNFTANDSSAFQKILSQARNYNLSLVLAHQNLSQIPKEMLSAILGNVHTIIVFHLGPGDAKLMQAAFADALPDKAAPKFVERLQNLSTGEAFIRFGTASNNIRIHTFPPPPLPKRTFVREVLEHSRARYGRPVRDAKRPQPWPIGSTPPRPQPEPEAKPLHEERPAAHPSEPDLPPIDPWEGPPIDPWQ